MVKKQDTPTTPPSPALLTTLEAAAYLNIQPATMEQHRWNGRGPRFVKIGRSVRYRQADLDAFLDARVFSNTTEAGNRDHA
jgi:excisionase family DNA binding protein